MKNSKVPATIHEKPNLYSKDLSDDDSFSIEVEQKKSREGSEGSKHMPRFNSMTDIS
jgi:hypothetical protein